MIKLLEPPFKVDPTITTDNRLDDERIHIISTAVKKESFCVAFLGRRGMTLNRISDFCDLVNVKNDVGTLYPKYRFSLIPYFDLSKGNEEELLHKHVKEVLKGHNGYFKNSTILLFVFDRQAGYNLQNIKVNLEQSIMLALNEYPDLMGHEFFYSIY